MTDKLDWETFWKWFAVIGHPEMLRDELRFYDDGVIVERCTGGRHDNRRA